LEVVPLSDGVTDLHTPRAGADYAVDRDRLPKGLIMFDWVKIEY
jgi:hypothetical protein